MRIRQLTIALLCLVASATTAQTAADIASMRRDAEAGNIRAQVVLGNCLLSGKGVNANHAEAVKWFARAAESGDIEALFNLAFCHENGYGVEKT